MKPSYPRFAVVTATRRAPVARACIESWQDHASLDWTVHQVVGQLGVVPAFAEGVAAAAKAGAEIICCCHDDVLIEQDGWDAVVIEHFETHPRCGLAGFAGGRGLGHAAIYSIPYEPHQLAREDFVSNLRDAEAHGRRVRYPIQVAALDGLSQIGRAEFFVDAWKTLQDLGMQHHFYDGALGCLAARAKLEAWMIPIRAHHYGGQTAVLDSAYNAWAGEQVDGGDAGFWRESHRIGYDAFRDVLPIRVG